MDTNTILAGIAIATSIGSVVVGILNRSHIKSKCCGKIIEASIEIDRNVDTPPIKIEIPKD